VPIRYRATFALSVALLAIVPASAHATLAFVRNPFNPSVWSAADNGSARHRIGQGSNPRVSPDGKTIVFLRQGKGRQAEPELMVVAADGSAAPRRLMTGWRETYDFAWSPDSTTVAAIRGPEVGRKTLVLVDVASGAKRTVAKGFFAGVSFDPGGSGLVYAFAGKEKFPLRSDVFRLGLPSPISSEPGVAIKPIAERRQRITRDHQSQYPLWGPKRRIVFVKLLGAKQRRYGPKNELFLMDPDGSHVKRLTHTKVDQLLQGLFPTEWSASGKQLLAEFEGQDTSYAVTVNPSTGRQHALSKDVEHGFAGTALSDDGRTVLGQTGGFEPGPDHDVATVPYGGGRPRVIVPNAFESDWSN
jgi:hypothetical protein